MFRKNSNKTNVENKVKLWFNTFCLLLFHIYTTEYAGEYGAQISATGSHTARQLNPRALVYTSILFDPSSKRVLWHVAVCADSTRTQVIRF